VGKQTNKQTSKQASKQTNKQKNTLNGKNDRLRQKKLILTIRPSNDQDIKTFVTDTSIAKCQYVSFFSQYHNTKY